MTIATGEQALASDVLALITRQFFVPCFSGVGGAIYNGGYTIADALDAAIIVFRVPNDFTTLTSVKIIIYPNSGGGSTLDWTAATTFGASGEAYNTHTDSQTADGQALTNNQLLELDISAAFTGLLANDIVILTFTADVWTGVLGAVILGLDIKYA